MSALASNVLTSKGGVLAYALPLLLTSTVLTFSGTYLTLDKTRAFEPLGDPENTVVLDLPGSYSSRLSLPDNVLDWEKSVYNCEAPGANPRFKEMVRSDRKKSEFWVFGGGVGGLLTGYLLGVFSPTVIALYVIQHSTRAITTVPFLIIVFLTGLVLSLLSARFHRAVLLFGCIGGSFAIVTFAAFAVNLSTTPKLSIWAALCFAISIVPLASLVSSRDRFYVSLHWTMRIAQSAFGSLGMIYSIAVLAHVPGWEDAMDSLWSATSTDGGATLALSVTGWILFVLGVGCDWFLFRTLGPSQGQRWDDYLSKYLDNLPNRAGRFERLPSLWSRISSLFHRVHDPLSDSLDEESLPSSTSIGRISQPRMSRASRRTTPVVRFNLASSSSEDGSAAKVEPLDDLSEDSTLLESEIYPVSEIKNGVLPTKIEKDVNISLNQLPTDKGLSLFENRWENIGSL